MLVATLLATSVAPASTGDVRSTERALRRCVNDERAKAGLPRLRASRPLTRAARAHARAMARRGFFDHRDPSGRDARQRVAQRTDRYGRAVGENIAAGQQNAQATCRDWMASAGHRANILNASFDHVGTGYARGGPYGRYLVQVFGAAR